MAPTQIEYRSRSVSYVVGQGSWESENAYRCHVALLPEEDGSVSAIVLNLPGAASCGDTDEEAIENVKDSVRGLIAMYTEDHQPIPWRPDSSFDGIDPGTKTVWILVNA